MLLQWILNKGYFDHPPYRGQPTISFKYVFGKKQNLKCLTNIDTFWRKLKNKLKIHLTRQISKNIFLK